MAGAGGVQEQARRFDSISGNDDSAGALEVLFAVAVEIDHAIDAAVLSQIHARGHGVSANLSSVLDGIGHVSDERACLGPDLAALQAKSAIDAVGAVAM